MKKIWKINKISQGNFKEKLQLFARGLLVPITLLAFAGLFLGIGSVIGKYVTDVGLVIFANIIKSIGNVVFYLLPLLFAIAIASSVTNNNGTAILCAVITWVAIQMIAGAQFVEMADNQGYSWFNVIDFKTVGGAGVITKPFGFNTIDMSVFGGFLAGPIAVFCYNHFKNQKMPVFLQMFAGQKFVPIMGLVISIPVAFLVALIWPWIQIGFIEFGQQTGKLPGGLDSFLFEIIERSLLPTGLHHMFYSPLMYTVAGATVDPTYALAHGVSVGGFNYGTNIPLWIIDASPFTNAFTDLMLDVPGLQVIDFANTPGLNYDPISKTLTVSDFQALENYYNAHFISDFKVLVGDRTAFQELNGSVIQFKWINNLTEGHSVHLGRFSAGKFPLMVFGIPAAGAAMIFAAPKENRKLVTGVVGSAALTSFLTGITEPFEYSFLFLAPALFYGCHIWLCGLSYLLSNVAGTFYAPTFGGIIDYFIYGVAPEVGGQYTGFYWLLLIGVGLAVAYFGIFYLAITKFNLPTPGRDGNTIKLHTKADFQKLKSNNKIKTTDSKIDQIVLKGHIMFQALGGKENLKNIANCASRLRVNVFDPLIVDHDLVKQASPYGIVGKNKNAQQYIFGPQVQTIADTVIGLYEGTIKPLNITKKQIKKK